MLTIVFSGLLASTAALAAKPAVQKDKAQTPSVYATVGKESITWVDYEYEYNKQVSGKFYHAKPTEAQLAEFQRQVGRTLVDNALLVLEAKRRKIKPDSDFVKQQTDQFDQRFSNDPNWPDARPRVMPIITKRFQNENLRKKLEEQVRNSVPPPTEQQLREYYAAHMDKFTSPPQPRVALILLRMDPSYGEEEWQKATEAAQDMVKRLRAGEDFAEMARQYSGDSTAEQGGDMGYLHAGMLPGLPEQTVNGLKPGEISDPVRLLEGVAIFRLIDRIPSVVNSFEDVKQRASQLLSEELSDNAWNSLVAQLKKKTPVQTDESRFVKFPAVADKPATDKPATDKPATDKPATDKPATDKPATDKPSEQPLENTGVAIKP